MIFMAAMEIEDKRIEEALLFLILISDRIRQAADGIVAKVSMNLDAALTLVCKCKRCGILRRVVKIVTTTNFRYALAMETRTATSN